MGFSSSVWAEEPDKKEVVTGVEPAQAMLVALSVLKGAGIIRYISQQLIALSDQLASEHEDLQQALNDAKTPKEKVRCQAKLQTYLAQLAGTLTKLGERAVLSRKSKSLVPLAQIKTWQTMLNRVDVIKPITQPSKKMAMRRRFTAFRAKILVQFAEEVVKNLSIEYRRVAGLLKLY